ncbi:tyrosine-type recombinase/integrase [Deinococcus yavapaiensis]|uniref:Integrase/recombinase XerC n=1 Tax=Deinococcus yavapaiensis KR-236 TaxID=694435 RepID=A0A318SE42_9DEIO|nr:site-specific integrase [Deinococcus yavapaiensis]PYE51028.1 integrase/recombinase XerC [Deinococcus yavapaiensis KR-236]
MWLRTLEASGKCTSTLRVYLAGTRALYRALRWAQAVRVDPFVDARPRKDATAAWDKRAPYPEEDVRRLLAYGDVEMRALVLLGAHGKLRASEIVRLTWGDVDGECRALRVVGKGGKVRVVSVTGSLRDALRALKREASEVLVIGRSPEAARMRLKRVCRRAGVTYRGLHALRHSVGTRIVRAGLSLQHVARHLGHVSVATAEVYAKWVDDALTLELERW